MPELNLTFMENPYTGESKQKEFFYLTCRNQAFSGGYGNGKTYIGCLKALYLLLKFPKYRFAILRASSVDLSRTTRETFFKICPPELYDQKIRGGRVDSRNLLTLNNGSEVYWLHLDNNYDSIVRGLELNGYLIDQAEEVDEEIYLHLDSRLDRWDVAEVPPELNPERFPKNKVTGKPKPPSYGMILCNPDLRMHWIYKRYHPESTDHHAVRYRTNPYTKEKIAYRYSDTHRMITATSYDNPSLSAETLAAMESRGKAFYNRFVLGKWGSIGGAVHEVSEKSKLIEWDTRFLDKIIEEGRIYRSLDHGDVSPTSMLWFIHWKQYFFCFQEYYKAGELISKHRENIAFMNTDSRGVYLKTVDICDPSMANKTQQKKGGLYSLIDEYATSEYSSPPINFSPGDNNEFVTRSRLDELLKEHPELEHPITGEKGSPRLFFLMKKPGYAFGCDKVVLQLESQRYVKIGTVDGEDQYGDDRDTTVEDHAYDALRYFVARVHQSKRENNPNETHPMAFRNVRERAIRLQRRLKRIAGVY